jgi:hypothetical protein
VRYLIPVSADGLKAFPAGGAALASQTESTTAPDEHAGLWVGSALIDKVSQPARAGSPDAPIAVGSPLEFRLILHVDAAGKVRLLQKVLQMFKKGILQQDPEDPAKNIVAQPGRYVLITDDSLIPQFTGATLRDGQPAARRISSAAFSFSQPILLTPASEGGSARFGAGSFHCQVDLGFDDSLNPFKHLYHPDHDNLDERFQQKLPDGRESMSVGRQLQLEFTAEDPDKLTIPGWGDNQVGGTYRETITGLHRRPIQLQGTFRLSLTSRIAELNDGQTVAASASR